MGRNSGGVRSGRRILNSSLELSSERDYYEESKRLRDEALAIAENYKNNPLRFSVTNEIEMDVEVTKSDIKTIVSKNTADDEFNAIKNALAKDIEGYIKKAKWVGWRETENGKHKESVFFVYYSRQLGANTYLALRKMYDGRYYKPYAILNESQFKMNESKLHKRKPPQ